LPDADLLDAALARLQEGVLIHRGASLAYANPAAQAMCRSHPLWNGEERLEDLLPGHALPHARAEGRWSDYVSFGEGRMLAARLYALEGPVDHTLLLLQDPGLVRDGEKELLRRHEELNVRLTAAQKKLLESEKLAS